MAVMSTAINVMKVVVWHCGVSPDNWAFSQVWRVTSANKLVFQQSLLSMVRRQIVLKRCNRMDLILLLQSFWYILNSHEVLTRMIACCYTSECKREVIKKLRGQNIMLV